MAAGDIVQVSPVLQGSGTVSLPNPVTSGNGVLLIWGSSHWNQNPNIPDWESIASVSQGTGQERRNQMMRHPSNPQSATIPTYVEPQATYLIEIEGAASMTVLNANSMNTVFSNTNPLPIELSESINANAICVASFVAGNASRAFNNNSWTNSYVHGAQSAGSASNARMIWGSKVVSEGTSSVHPTSVAYSDSPPQSLGVIVALAIDDEGGGTDADKIVATYYPNYERGTNVGQTSIENLNWNAFTHLFDFSVGLHDGRVSATWTDNWGNTEATNWWSPENADALVAAANAQGKKVILCLGSNDTSDSFSDSLDTALKRQQVAEDLADLMVEHGYSGVDFDGEPAADTANYQELIIVTRQEFESRGWRTPGSPNYKTLSVVCFGSETATAKDAIQNGVDWVAPMLYVPWEDTSRHLSPITQSGYLGSWSVGIENWASGTDAIPRSQILPGFSYYVRRWPGTSGPDQAGTADWTEYDWDFVNSAIGGVEAPNATWYGTSPPGDGTAGAEMHGMTIDSAWHSFESGASLKSKAKYVVDEDLGGVVIWNYQHGSLGNDNHPLAASTAEHFGPLMYEEEPESYSGSTQTSITISDSSSGQKSESSPSQQLDTPVVTITGQRPPSSQEASDGEIDIFWAAVSGAAAYRIGVAEGEGVTSGFTVISENIENTYYTIGGLSSDVYTIGVQAQAENTMPVASFTMDPDSGVTIGQLVIFDGTSSTGEITNYEWDDAASLYSPAARGTWPMNVNDGPIGEMTYQNPGTKYPRLWVDGPDGTHSTVQILEVSDSDPGDPPGSTLPTTLPFNLA